MGSLAGSFDGMLDRLETSRDELDRSLEAQRRLVADASHELRTPITSLTTNLELLSEHPSGSDPELLGLIGAALAQTGDLTATVEDLLELTREDGTAREEEPVRLDEITALCIERARRNHPTARFTLNSSPTVVDGRPDRLGRAIDNLLTNAAVHGGGEVEVAVDSKGVSVGDRGPGIPDGEVERVFDRFHRGASTQNIPGTGLGLAIVEQVAGAHGGSASVEPREGGGPTARLRLSGAAPDHPGGEPD